MDKDLVEKQLLSLIKEVLEIQKVDINQTMDDIPEWDSLKHIQLLSAIENHFDLEIDFEKSLSMVDIRSMMELVNQRTN